MSQVFQLTDDECIAAAVLSGTPWPAPLPTVDLTDPGTVAAALRRGALSLGLRGLAQDASGGALSEPVRAYLAGARGGQLLAGYAARADDPAVSLGGGIFARSTETGWVVELVDGRGLHQVEPATTELLARSVDESARAAFDGALHELGMAWVVCRSGPEGQLDLTVITRGSVRTAVTTDGVVSTWSAERPSLFLDPISVV